MAPFSFHSKKLFRLECPSFFFERGDLHRAKALREPVLSRPRLHVSDFASLCLAKINVHRAEGDHREAKHWVAMLRQSIPDHPPLTLFNAQLQGPR
jgi:hypothetical protein